jgi:two-component system sensor kinase FixL
MAHDDVDLDEVREILTDIVDQDKRAGEVIHRLRLLLKKGEVEQRPLDVNNAVEEVLKLIRGDLLNHSVTTLTKLEPARPTVKGDRVQLQQVLLNLVMNACDAMNDNPPADRQIVVSTELCDGAGVRFSVRDRGPGVTEGNLEQVFEPFFTSKAHGLGLGLSVCRSIITAHGGKLWAANNPERGATFHFILPVSNGG